MKKLMFIAATIACASFAVAEEATNVTAKVTVEPIVTLIAPADINALKTSADTATLLNIISNLNERIAFLEEDLVERRTEQAERRKRMDAARERLKNKGSGKLMMKSAPISCTPSYQEARERINKKFPTVIRQKKVEEKK